MFQGRFLSIRVDSDEYLRYLCLYIHTNPVKDGFALAPELWPYSNYAEWVDERRWLPFDDADAARRVVEQAFVAEFFGSPARYREFVRDWPLRKQMPAPLRSHVAALERAE